mgnify:CR=1 FL=1
MEGMLQALFAAFSIIRACTCICCYFSSLLSFFHNCLGLSVVALMIIPVGIHFSYNIKITVFLKDIYTELKFIPVTARKSKSVTLWLRRAKTD